MTVYGLPILAACVRIVAIRELQARGAARLRRAMEEVKGDG